MLRVTKRTHDEEIIRPLKFVKSELAEMITLRDVVSRDIAMVFGMPKEMLGISRGKSGAV